MQKVSSQMTTDADTFTSLTRSLERSEARRLGIGITTARVGIARRLGITPTTLENHLYKRLKVIPHWLMTQVREELIKALGREIAHLEREIELHRKAGADPDDRELVAAEAKIAEARQYFCSPGSRHGAGK